MTLAILLVVALAGAQTGAAKLKQEAERGDALSMCLLADYYRLGLDVPHDPAQAMQWYQKAAKADSSCGKLGLGLMLLRGDGIPKNETEAIKWLEEAAIAGIATAQLIMGEAAEEGKYGVKQDYKQAAEWYRDAADVASTEGMVRLGQLYEKGLGVPRDLAQAAKLYREGAEMGEPNPMYWLSLLYYKGTGVPRDWAEAHKWMNLAATRAMGEEQRQLASVRDDLTKQLSPEQLTEAQKRARDWLAAFEKSRDVAGGRFGGVTGGVPAVPPPPPAAVRVGGAIKEPAKLKDVPPVYPPIAQSARVQGIVILEVTIGPDGKVRDAKIVRSIPLLDQAAIDAVMQWEFTPTLLNGVPVPVIMTVTSNFRLQ